MMNEYYWFDVEMLEVWQKEQEKLARRAKWDALPEEEKKKARNIDKAMKRASRLNRFAN